MSRASEAEANALALAEAEARLARDQELAREITRLKREILTTADTERAAQLADRVIPMIAERTAIREEGHVPLPVAPGSLPAPNPPPPPDPEKLEEYLAEIATRDSANPEDVHAMEELKRSLLGAE